MRATLLVFDSPEGLHRALLGARQRRVATAGLAVAALAFAAAAAITWEAQRLRAKRDQQATAYPVPALPTPSAVKPPTDREIAAWNEAVLQLNTPWPALLAILEQATPADVALVSIEPDARSRSVRMVAEAKSLDTLLRYAQQLQGRAPVGAVMPARHETNDQDPNKPMRLQLQLGLMTGPSPEPRSVPGEQQR